jgi:hypothetical protein
MTSSSRDGLGDLKRNDGRCQEPDGLDERLRSRGIQSRGNSVPPRARGDQDQQQRGEDEQHRNDGVNERERVQDRPGVPRSAGGPFALYMRRVEDGGRHLNPGR